MTRDQHQAASLALTQLIQENCKPTGNNRNPETATRENGLFGMLALHHAKQGASFARCDDCYLGFSLPDPDNSPECPWCKGAYTTIVAN